MAAKFVEAEYEKVDRLMELLFRQDGQGARNPRWRGGREKMPGKKKEWRRRGWVGGGGVQGAGLGGGALPAWA